MRPNYVRLFLHIVFSTSKRQPLIQPDIERQLYAAITEKCRQLQCIPLAIGGIEDHVHLLVRPPTTLTIAQLLKEIKGASSHLINHQLAPGINFRWQGTSGVFSVSERHVPIIERYILRQKEHHQHNSLYPTLETTEELPTE
jgi:putative transposase